VCLACLAYLVCLVAFSSMRASLFSCARRNIIRHNSRLPRALSTSSAKTNTTTNGGSVGSAGEEASGKSTHFGFQDVPEGNKKPLVGEVFHRVANNYDVMNDVMSVGVHRVWKSQFISMLNPQPGMKHLDMAGGTGDIAFGCIDALVANADPTSSSVTVSDINASMLGVGEERAVNRGYFSLPKVELSFVEADAEALPFEDNTFDSYTIAFGLRNVTNIDQALSEAHRVLKPGGRYLCLEFSKVENPLFAQFYDTYSFNVIPFMGQVVSSDRASYQYLVESIRKHPSQPELLARMETQGFRCSSYTNLTGGVVAIHSGFKIASSRSGD